MLTTIILFIVILGVLIFVHEFGHFITAKRMGMRVDEFGFGFPPRVCGIMRHTKSGRWRWIWLNKLPPVDELDSYGTIYSVNFLPIGGFVKIKGEQGDQTSDTDSFSHKDPWRRAVVLAAGVIMNVLFAFFVLSIGFSVGLPGMANTDTDSGAIVSNQHLQIVQVEPSSPAEEAGLQAGDIITSIDNTEPQSVEEFQSYTEPRLGEQLVITYTRGELTDTTTVIPTSVYEAGKGAIGIGLAETALVRYPWYQAIWMGLKATISLFVQILVGFAMLVWALVTGAGGAIDVAGPVGVAVLTGQVAQLGFVYVLQFVAFLSINLAIINAIPFPALDGGRLLFLLIEKIRGKAMRQRTEALINTVGFFTLILLVLIVTFRDIGRFTDLFSGLTNIL